MTAKIIEARFDGDKLALIQDLNCLWIDVSCVCRVLRIDERRQVRKLREYRWAVVRTLSVTDWDGRTSNRFVLDLECFGMWLSLISRGRLSRQHREKLRRYQRDGSKAIRGDLSRNAQPVTEAGTDPRLLRVIGDVVKQVGQLAALQGVIVDRLIQLEWSVAAGDRLGEAEPESLN